MRVRTCYGPVAQALVQRVITCSREVRLVLDTTRGPHRAQLVLVGLAFHRRVLPLAWTWLRKGKGHSSGTKQRVLLARVHAWISKGAIVFAGEDSEFGSVVLIKQGQVWGWEYVLHQ